MCGIAGGAWTRTEANVAGGISPATLVSMTTTIAHRGPDGAAFYWQSVDQLTDLRPGASGSCWSQDEPTPPGLESRLQGIGVALGHRRLSVIDLSPLGQQPMCNEDGRVWTVFNGEIYNYAELRQWLILQGHVFRSQTDTEVIVHAYEEEGPACLSRFRGMFSLAIWDQRQHRLILARDRLGKKPLVYRIAGGQLTFASELKALLQVPGAPREVDPHALAQFAALQYVPHPYSMLRGYAKLPPAHWGCFELETGRWSMHRYWRAPYRWTSALHDQEQTPPTPQTPAEWRSAVREELTTAVRLRLRSDVPLGAFLSGGVDSTVIAGLMQQQSDRRIQTFAIGFPEARFDERSFARQAAAHLGTEHQELLVEPSALELLPQLAWHYDEPFADSSAIPTLLLSQWARHHVTVALTGDGGDELFAGYDRYKAVLWSARLDQWPAWLRWMATASWWRWVPASIEQKSALRRLRRFGEMLALPAERRYLNWISIIDDTRRPALWSPELAASLQGFDAGQSILNLFAESAEPDPVQRVSAVDVESYLPGDILTKVDLASMSCGLECRSPFLDQRVVELAARCPASLKWQGGRGKRVLVEAFPDLLPAAIQARPKMGFGVPLDHWFRGPLRSLVADTLLSSRATARGFFQAETVQQLVDEHLSSRQDHSARLWLLLVLERWCQTFLDGAT